MVQKVLLDTNILLEILLQQERFKECFHVLERLSTGKFSAVVTNVAFLSLVIVAHRKKISSEKIEYFFSIIFGIPSLTIEVVDSSELSEIFRLSHEISLDVEDSIQYFVAKKLGLPLMTLDKDFTKTDLQIIDPKDIL